MRWEYRTEYVSDFTNHYLTDQEMTATLLAITNQYGDLGWELVSTELQQGYRLFFKRQVVDE